MNIKAFVATLLLAGPIPAMCQANPTLTDTAIDLAFYRPAGLFQTLLGSAVFPVLLPMSLVASALDRSLVIADVAESLVIKPAEFTFVRPLGISNSEWQALRRQEEANGGG
ncbi:hypothetical protein [Methylomonas sp. HYX-M1]|uniref:hypothetical protein n=1 Tax=Methylomonas sp. HYX-M1 TaxID=3139307 RepID=UPI00345B9285